LTVVPGVRGCAVGGNLRRFPTFPTTCAFKYCWLHQSSRLMIQEQTSAMPRASAREDGMADVGQRGRASRRRPRRCPYLALLMYRVLCAPVAGAGPHRGPCAGCIGTNLSGSARMHLLPGHSLRAHAVCAEGSRAATAARGLRLRGGSEAPGESGGGAKGAAPCTITTTSRSPVRKKKKRKAPVEPAKIVADARGLRAACLHTATAVLGLCASIQALVLAVLMLLRKPVVMVTDLVSGLAYRALCAITRGLGDLVSLYVDGMVAFQDAGACGSGQLAAAGMLPTQEKSCCGKRILQDSME